MLSGGLGLIKISEQPKAYFARIQFEWLLLYIHIYIYMCMYKCVCICVYIYIFKEKEWIGGICAWNYRLCHSNIFSYFVSIYTNSHMWVALKSSYFKQTDIFFIERQLFGETKKWCFICWFASRWQPQPELSHSEARSQKSGGSSRFSLWVQDPKDLGYPLLLSQVMMGDGGEVR